LQLKSTLLNSCYVEWMVSILALKYGDTSSNNINPLAQQKQAGLSIMLDGALFIIVLLGIAATFNDFSNSKYSNGFSELIVTIVWLAVLFVKINFTTLRYKFTNKACSVINRKNEIDYSYLDTSLQIGLSTGKLASRGHKMGLEADQVLNIPFPSCCTNFIALGSTGEGKTAFFIKPMLSQLCIASNCSMGGLIFDIKGNFIFEDVLPIMEHQGQMDRFKIIGTKPGQLKINLIAGLNPEQVTDYLCSVYLLAGNKKDIDFWLTSALLLTKNALRILIYTRDYTLRGLYQFAFKPERRKMLMDEAKRNHAELLEPDIDFQNAVDYYEKEFSALPENMQGSINGSLTPILEPFQGAELQTVFSDINPENNYDLSRILNDGDIIAVDLNLATYASPGRAIYTLIKLRYYNLIQTRFNPDSGLNKERYCFFMCDEFQDLIAAGSAAGLNDATFFSKSRSQRNISIVTSQSYSALANAVGGDDKLNTILANFVNKIVFKLNDAKTIKYIQSLVGTAEVQKVSYNEGTSQRGWGNDTSDNQGYSVQTVDKNVIDAELISQLGVVPGTDNYRYALLLSTIDGNTANDVIITTALPRE